MSATYSVIAVALLLYLFYKNTKKENWKKSSIKNVNL
jgi:hypothetical protein